MRGALINTQRKTRLYLPVKADRPGYRPATEVIAALVVVGLMASWIAAVYPVEQSLTLVGPDHKLVMQLVKGPIYYAAHALSICCLTLGGVLSALDGQWRVLDFGTRCAFYVLLAESALWSYYGYTTEELLSAKVFGATGPFVWITVLVVIAGADPRLWRYLDPTIRWLAYASSLMAVRTLLTVRYASFGGESRYTEYTKLLLWLGGWTLLSATRAKGWSLVLRFLPIVCLIPVALCSQSRSLTLESILLILLFIVLRAREQGSVLRAVPLLVGVCIAGCLAGLLIYSIVPQTVDASVNGLNARMTDDTRSGQYTDFFEVVPLGDLVLGRGPNGTWYWRGLGDISSLTTATYGCCLLAVCPLYSATSRSWSGRPFALSW